MILITGIDGAGVRIGVVTDATARLVDVPYFDIPSERYLLQIENCIHDIGGWGKITDWIVSEKGESFTSLRGLITIVNALSPVHNLPVSVFLEDGISVKKVEIPMLPGYSTEPNISNRK
jgi:hypothetical protein